MITAELLYDALNRAGIPGPRIFIFDDDYQLPSPMGITGNLSDEMSRILFANQIKWTESQFDCNKFAKLATVLADLAWMNTRKEETALAFGVFGYGGHMLNVAVHLKQDEADPSREITADDLRVEFYEPQPTVDPGTLVYAAAPLRPRTLSREEIKSCLICQFV